VDGARALGAEIILAGTTSIERKARAEAEAARRGLAMVPPFDHPDIIAGQGTVGLEILEDCPAVDRVYVPVGGGGLLAGVAAAIKPEHPRVGIIGVEPAGAAKMGASLEAGRPVTLQSTRSIADGLLPVRPGDLTFAHVRQWVDRVISVDEDAIVRAVARLTTGEKLVVEPSGAVSVAGALAEAADGPAATVVCVLSGGNIAPDVLASLVAGRM
jgi:threonine dehydratase